MAKSKLFRSTMIVSSMTMLSRILGLVRDMVLMGVFGAGGLMDAFLVAFKIPNYGVDGCVWGRRSHGCFLSRLQNPQLPTPSIC